MRPACWAYAHVPATSPALRITDWPLPEDDITGLMTHGVPSASTAAWTSSSVSQKR